MTQEAATEAARIILKHWRAGTRIAALPDHLTPTSDAEGHAIQAALTSLSGAEPVGWKIAATSAAGQAHIGVPGPLPGRLLADHCHAEGATLPFGGNAMRVIEAEFAFVIGRTLSPRPTPYSQDDVMAAVDRLHLGLEIPDSRFEDFATMGGPALIADNACAHDFVLGPIAGASWRDLDLATHPVTLTVTGADNRVERHDGIGANVLGDPRIALTWLANALSRIGVPLEGGQIVTTGTCIVPAPIKPGDRIEADFGPLGRVTTRFAER